MLIEDTLRPTYDAVVAHGAAAVKDGTGKVMVNPDSFYLLKHLASNTAAYARELGQLEELMKQHAAKLKHLRNRLAHATPRSVASRTCSSTSIVSASSTTSIC